MIVPRDKLLIWSASLTLPLALVAGIAPETGAICAALVGLFALVAVTDAYRAPRGLSGIGVEIPSVSRMSKDRESRLDVRIHNESSRRHSIRIALGFPAEIQSTPEDQDAILPENAEWSRLSWT